MGFSGFERNRERAMSNKTATNWLLISLLMAATATVTVTLILKAAALFWFQALFQSSQPFLG